MKKLFAALIIAMLCVAFGVVVHADDAQEDVVYKDGEWVYVIGDEVQYDFTGLKPNEYGWWYIENGRVNFGYTGLRPNEAGWWRIVNGNVDFGFTGLMPDVEGNWWYLEDGHVNFGYTGIQPNDYGWWRIDCGRVDFGFTGLAANEYGWWYLENGLVNFGYTGIRPNEAGWWRIVNGNVDFGYTGLMPDVEGNWWYINNGMVDFSYTGFAGNEYGWWYVQNGHITFGANGTIYGTINGETRDYFVSASRVKFGSDQAAMTALAQGYSSSTGWLILVDCSENVFGVFTGSQGNWTLNQYWQCTTGAGATPTPKGIFQINYKIWGFSGPETTPNLDYWSGYTVYYASNYAAGGYFIHSTLYHYGSWDDLDPTLGADLSHGCIRLETANAKWLQDNVPLGTTVVTY